MSNEDFHFPLNITEHKFKRSAFSHTAYLFLLLKNCLKLPLEVVVFSSKISQFFIKKENICFDFLHEKFKQL